MAGPSPCQRTSPRRRVSMRIATYGTSGVGGYYGTRLAHAGEDADFIARGKLRFCPMRSTGPQYRDCGP
jgi:ketopantoate reductase